MCIERECPQGSEKASPGSAVQREHRTGEPSAALHVEESKRFANLPMGNTLMLSVARFGLPGFNSWPPALCLDIVISVSPIGCLGSRHVRKEEERSANGFARSISFNGGSALLIAENAALISQGFCRD